MCRSRTHTVKGMGLHFWSYLTGFVELTHTSDATRPRLQNLNSEVPHGDSSWDCVDPEWCRPHRLLS